MGGNIYDYHDEKTGILMNKYGAHLFHTHDKKVWKYINQFDRWIRWDHRVVGKIDNDVFPIPVNINTVNILCGEHISNTMEMQVWLKKRKNNTIIFKTRKKWANPVLYFI